MLCFKPDKTVSFKKRRKKKKKFDTNLVLLNFSWKNDLIVARLDVFVNKPFKKQSRKQLHCGDQDYKPIGQMMTLIYLYALAKLIYPG